MRQKQAGFTLIEMMVVLMIISTLLLVTIPNVAQNNNAVKDKGCEALVKLVEAQRQAYEIKEGKPLPTLETLVTQNYIKSLECPNNQVIELADDEITAVPKVPTGE